MRHYRVRTEEAYVSWIKRLILFHGKHHPLEYVRQRHQHDLVGGFGRVYVPNALQRKYPHANGK
jgi:hypothetical protein